MDTEQKQRQFLYAALTLIFFAAIFLYSASLFDQNVAEINQIESPVSVSGNLQSEIAKIAESMVPVVPAKKQAEPVVVADDWKTYRNTKYGIEFRYPKEWPAPVLEVPGKGKSGLPEDQNIKTVWRINLGEREKICEGEWCYVFALEGYAGNHKEGFLEELEYIDDMYPQDLIESESTVNGLDQVVFLEGSSCGLRSAYVFGKNAAIKFVSECGDSDSERIKTFDAILSTLKLTK